jgi:hypothetical protein
MRYTISYDLNSPGKDYQRLYDALAGLSARRILLSEWVTKRYNTSAASLRNYLWQFMDANDRLIVTCLDSTDWAGMNLLFNPNSLESAA